VLQRSSTKNKKEEDRMRKLLLLIVAVCLFCVVVSPAISADPEQKTMPMKKTVYMVPAKIVVFNEGIAEVTDPIMIKALEKHAQENECVLKVEIPGGSILYMSYCGTPIKPICYRSPDGKQCCPGQVPLCR
jgi:Na+/H+-dicarboxylate symporter